METALAQQPVLQERPQHRRNKSSTMLKSIIVPKRHKRTSSEDVYQQPISTPEVQDGISSRTTMVPLLPPDHPAAQAMATAQVRATARASEATSRKGKENQAPRSKSRVSLRGRGQEKEEKWGESERSKSKSPKKAKKSKSSTSLSAMFAKMNRSSKDLHDTPQATADKENMAPSSPAKVPLETPIWAQYAMEKAAVEEPSKRLSVISIQGRSRTLEEEIALYTPENYSPSKQRNFQGYQPTLSRPTSSARPKSFIDVLGRKLSGERSRPTSRGSDELKLEKRDSKEGCRRSSGGGQSAENRGMFGRKVSSSSTEQPPPKPDLRVTKRGNRVMAAVAAINTKVNGPTMLTAESQLDPKEVDAAFEAVLEARNVPENMRQKMRTLTLRVKADFIKQDKGSQATPIPANKRDSKCSNWSHSSEENSVPQSSQNGSAAKVDENAKEDKPARPRSKTFSSSKTFTFSKGDKSGKGESSPKKQKGGESRSRPTSMHIEQSASMVSLSGNGPSSSSHKGPKAVSPDDFVNYLRAVPDPTKVEVGRLHKLRLLLRNETVAWVDSFISLGGMTEIVQLLHRIMAIEWREEHEDQLLHETLLCLKGLSTTEVALKKLDDMADSLFPALLGMLFDEEKKGPSEFNTRAIIINVLFAHLSAVSRSDATRLEQRARKVISYLADPQKPEDAQPIPFVLSMRQSRPYRMWCREVSNVSKEVFWIFLHHLNVVPLPSSRPATSDASAPDAASACGDSAVWAAKVGSPEQHSYTTRHFPGLRPPVPAAPYIGGVEWDATTYIAAHLDLLNGLLASLPTCEARDFLRSELQASGWEKLMGGTLRTCKEKFYGGVHDGLRSWVAAAAEDGWDTAFVRCGPTKEDLEREMVARSPKKSPKKKEEVPKIEALPLPKLDLDIGAGAAEGGKEVDGWLM